MKKLPLLAILTSLLLSCASKQDEQDLSAALFFKHDALLAEGPIWNHETNELYWIDIEGFQLHILDVKDKTQKSFETPSRIGTVVPIDRRRAIVGLQDGAYIFDRDSGSFERYAAIDSSNKATRLNDGKCDPAGRFWVGTMYMPQDKAAGNLFSVDSSAQVVSHLDNITISNGIVWTADQRIMYYIDSPTQEIRAYDFDVETGIITNPRIVLKIERSMGEPDGMAMDELGNLWIGLWNGNAVIKVDPKAGESIGKIAVPAHNVTACAFGGKNLDSLFITTASLDMTEDEQKLFPNAGSIFVAGPGVKGVRSTFFRLGNN